MRAAGALALLCVLGCAGCARRDDLGSVVARLQALTSDPGRRPLVELDVMGDGDVDADDVRLLDRLTAESKKLAADNQIDLSIATGFYQGPTAGAASALSFLRAGNETFDLSAVPLPRLRELAIESRWLGLEARLAAAAHVSPSASPFGGMLQRSLPGYESGEMEPAEVCEALTAAEPKIYADAGLPRTAVLDLDSTVWAGNGTDGFLAAMIELKLLHAEGNAAVQAFLKTLAKADAERIDQGSVLDTAKLLLERSTDSDRPERERVSPKDSFYNIVELMRGMSAAEAQRAADHAIRDGALGFSAWRTRVYADRDGCGMNRIVELLVQHGYDVYLLSATPDVMVEAAGRMLGLPEGHAVGSALELAQGRYTGKVRDNTYTVKAAIVRQWLPSPPYVAFGDSPTSDFPMLIEASATGFMVNPQPQFLERDSKEAQSRLVALSFDATEGELARAP